MGVRQWRGWISRLWAWAVLGRAVLHAFEAAAEDGEITEAELGALAVRAVRLYEEVTGRALVVRRP